MKRFAPKDFLIQKMFFPFVQNNSMIASKADYRRRLGISEKDFIFLFSFDYLSSFERKNPLAVVEAFKLALAGEDRAKLVIKTNNSYLFPKENAELERAGIIKLEHTMSKAEMMTLLQISDAYVSLHRAEGLGIGMMEAMAFGKPVIATAYSGNMEFMDGTNSLLIDYKKTKIAKPFMQHYTEETEWAEPDIEMAARYMAKLFHNRRFANRIGRKAKASIANYTNEIRYTEHLYNFIRGIHE